MSEVTQSGLFDVGLFDVAKFDYVYYIGIDRQICVSSTITNTIEISSTLKKVC